MSPLMLAPCETALAVAAAYGEVRIYDMREVTNPVEGVSFSYCSETGNGKRRKVRNLTVLCWGPVSRQQLALGSEDHLVTVWTLASTACKVATLAHSSAPITDLCWQSGSAPDTEVLVSCSRDGQLRLYSPDHWSLLLVFSSSADPFLRIALDPTRSLLCACSQSGLLSLFDLRSRKRTAQWRTLGKGTSGLSWRAQWLGVVSGVNSLQVFAV